MFENVDTHTYPLPTKAYLYYKLTYEPKDSGELIRWCGGKWYIRLPHFLVGKSGQLLIMNSLGAAYHTTQ